jgi:hypothetical protein
VARRRGEQIDEFGLFAGWWIGADFVVRLVTSPGSNGDLPGSVQDDDELPAVRGAVVFVA